MLLGGTSVRIDQGIFTSMSMGVAGRILYTHLPKWQSLRFTPSWVRSSSKSLCFYTREQRKELCLCSRQKYADLFEPNACLERRVCFLVQAQQTEYTGQRPLFPFIHTYISPGTSSPLLASNTLTLDPPAHHGGFDIRSGADGQLMHTGALLPRRAPTLCNAQQFFSNSIGKLIFAPAFGRSKDPLNRGPSTLAKTQRHGDGHAGTTTEKTFLLSDFDQRGHGVDDSGEVLDRREGE